MEDLTDWASELNTDPNNTYNLDSVLAGQADLAHTSSTSTTCLEEILQSCSEVFLKRLKKYFFLIFLASKKSAKNSKKWMFYGQ